ncbi:hypothetical protein HYV11_02200 [Candidatus Dependentiae bacterium]|nr:hypothetical protein [Candidatus Dependentiae bacterium]
MKRNNIILLFFAIFCDVCIRPEEVVIKKKKTESTVKIKEQIACDLEDILRLSTQAIKKLTNTIDEVVGQVKQLAGQQAGILASADKKQLELFQVEVARLKKTLLDFQSSAVCNYECR